MADLNEVADRIALQDVMLRYAAGVDERDMEMYRSCFADDCEIHGFGESVVTGGDAWTEDVKGKLEAFGATQHMLGPMLATIDGDTARTRTDVQAQHYMADDPKTTLTLWATYKTDMKKIDGAWKISRHELVRRGVRVQTDS
ncbi:MAG: nuclear transport factor 2 family protein [Proteobacteria bacterium]|nr:nuclear transport factor 2 family protein [Pseudomonadota bacterium]